MTGLRIAEGLAALPIDAVTSTFAILAKKGAGKTHTASVLAEEMVGEARRPGAERAHLQRVEPSPVGAMATAPAAIPVAAGVRSPTRQVIR